MEKLNFSKTGYNIYKYFTFFLYFSYFLFFFGISIVNIQYLHILLIIVHIMLCFYLLIRFNIFNYGNLNLNYFEKSFIFSAAILLFFNTLIYEIGIKLNLYEYSKYIPIKDIVNNNTIIGGKNGSSGTSNQQ
jgi:hypothetical protein